MQAVPLCVKERTLAVGTLLASPRSGEVVDGLASSAFMPISFTMRSGSEVS